jgi:hypothetical protein
MTTPNEMTEVSKNVTKSRYFLGWSPVLGGVFTKCHEIDTHFDTSRTPDFMNPVPPMKSDTIWGWFWHMISDVTFGGHLDMWNWSTFEWFLTWSRHQCWWSSNNIMSVNLGFHEMTLHDVSDLVHVDDICHTPHDRYMVFHIRCLGSHSLEGCR